MDMAKPSVGTGIDVTDQDLQPHVQMVHKLQKAVAHFNASRQRLQQQEASSTPSRESINHDESDDKIMEAREQRSQIAIIQMAPPAQGSSSSKSSNASTPFVGSSNETVTVPTAINDTDSDPKSQEPVAPAASGEKFLQDFSHGMSLTSIVIMKEFYVYSYSYCKWRVTKARS